MPEFNPWPILAALERHDVRYVVIGGIAAVIAGAPFVTRGLDVTPDRKPANLDRLASALTELGAVPRIADAPPDVESPLDGAIIAGFQNLSLDTPYGQLDLVLLPDGTRGFEDLVRAATRRQVAGNLEVLVASLADVIRSKAAAGRTKDNAQLPLLRETLERSHRS